MEKRIGPALMKRLMLGYHVSFGRDLTEKERKARKKKNKAQKLARRKNRLK